MYKNLNDYQIKNYKKQTKKELLQQLDWMQGSLNKANLNDDFLNNYDNK